MVEGLYRLLSRHYLAPRTLGVNEYDYQAPLEAIRRLMNESQGLLSVAFKKTSVEKGETVRMRGRQRPEKEILEGTSFTSPWVQIEAAMAYQLQLPVLILREKGVVADGILEQGVVAHHLPEFDLQSKPEEFLRSDDFRGIFPLWAAKVRSAAPGWTSLRA